METKLGKGVQSGRRAKGWSTRELAEQLTTIGAPVSWRTIEQWEQSARCPRPEAMEALFVLGILDRPVPASATEGVSA